MLVVLWSLIGALSVHISLILSIKIIVLVLLWGWGNGLGIAISDVWVYYAPAFLAQWSRGQGGTLLTPSYMKKWGNYQWFLFDQTRLIKMHWVISLGEHNVLGNSSRWLPHAIHFSIMLQFLSVNNNNCIMLLWKAMLVMQKYTRSVWNSQSSLISLMTINVFSILHTVHSLSGKSEYVGTALGKKKFKPVHIHDKHNLLSCILSSSQLQFQLTLPRWVTAVAHFIKWRKTFPVHL